MSNKENIFEIAEGASDLTDIISNNIRLIMGREAASMFENSPIIKSVKNNHQNVQRVIINRYFVKNILIHRSTEKHYVVDLLSILFSEGRVKNWLDTITKLVLPYLENNKIKFKV